jgi:hypothetical protein
MMLRRRCAHALRPASSEERDRMSQIAQMLNARSARTNRTRLLRLGLLTVLLIEDRYLSYYEIGWEAGIRTPISRSRVRSRLLPSCFIECDPAPFPLIPLRLSRRRSSLLCRWVSPCAAALVHNWCTTGKEPNRRVLILSGCATGLRLGKWRRIRPSDLRIAFNLASRGGLKPPASWLAMHI